MALGDCCKGVPPPTISWVHSRAFPSTARKFGAIKLCGVCKDLLRKNCVLLTGPCLECEISGERFRLGAKVWGGVVVWFHRLLVMAALREGIDPGQCLRSPRCLLRVLPD